MKKLLSSILFGCTIITGCIKDNTTITAAPKNEEFSATSGFSNPVENIRDVPVDAIFYNECCDEEVFITGLGHFIITRNIIHLKVTNIAGTGLSTGYNYTSQSPPVETNIFYSNQFEGTLTFIMNLDNENGCGFKLKATLHITMNANGIITAAFANITTTCF